MIINIKQIPSGRSVITQDVVLTDQMAEASCCAGVITCRAEVDKLHFQIHAHVTFSCVVSLDCSRCLNKFSHPLTCDFRVIFQNRDTQKSLYGGLENEADGYYSEEDNEIDMQNFIYDEIMTSIPLMPLCSINCIGIKTTNIIDHQGPAALNDTIDPRWEALKKLKKI